MKKVVAIIVAFGMGMLFAMSLAYTGQDVDTEVTDQEIVNYYMDRYYGSKSEFSNYKTKILEETNDEYVYFMITEFGKPINVVGLNRQEYAE